jgi:hypothetical protein
MPPHFSHFTTSAGLRAALVRHARSFVGRRYRHLGRGLAARDGFDCLGLLVRTAHDFSIPFAEAAGDAAYSLAPDSDYFVSRLSEEMVTLPHWREALPADVLLTRWAPGLPPTHLGIVERCEAGGGVVCVHASRMERAVVCNRWDREDLITHAFRIRELDRLTRREAAL